MSDKPSAAAEILDAEVKEIIADVLCDTQGIVPRPLEHTRAVVKERIERYAAERVWEARLDEMARYGSRVSVA